MPVVELGQLYHWLGTLFLPFVRIAACLMVAPVFGAHYVPARIRILLAALFTYLLAPLLPPAPAGPLLSGTGLWLTVQQLSLGVASGFAMQLLFDALALGGQLIANGMGLGFAFNLDPLRGVATPALGQLYVVLGTLVFLSLNGHIALLEWLAHSFRQLPPGADSFGAEAAMSMARWGAQMFSGALQVALPAMTALLVVNLAFGAMSRAAPALNLFAIGLPVTLCFGLVVVLFTLPTLRTAFVAQLGAGFEYLNSWSGR